MEWKRMIEGREWENGWTVDRMGEMRIGDRWYGREGRI